MKTFSADLRVNPKLDGMLILVNGLQVYFDNDGCHLWDESTHTWLVEDATIRGLLQELGRQLGHQQ